MADIKKLAPLILKWEGGFVNDKHDKGGATNMGVTLSTWRSIGYDKDGDGDIDAQDIKLLTKLDFERVLNQYWKRWKADLIHNQSVANLLVDWVWTSGKWGIVRPQRLLGVKDDGLVGNTTLGVLNSRNQRDLFNDIYRNRLEFFEQIVKNDPTQERFIDGWKNRLHDFKFYENV